MLSKSLNLNGFKILSTMFLMVIFFTFEIDLNGSNEKGVKNSSILECINTPGAKAQGACFETCLTGLDSCSGTDCVNKWICGTGCDCSFSWVKYNEDFETSTCSKDSSPPVE